MNNDRKCKAATWNWDAPIRYALVGLGLIGAGVFVGAETLRPSEARGEVRAGPPPVAFESGGQLSLPILRDISATLHQMDVRLARMETIAKQVQKDLSRMDAPEKLNEVQPLAPQASQ